MTTAADANPTTIADRVAKMHEAMAGQIPDEVLGAFVAEQAGLDTRGIPTGIAEPGDTLGDFDLLDVHGAPTTVSAALGGRTAVIVLYRGAWCPYCNLALRAYQDDLAPHWPTKASRWWPSARRSPTVHCRPRRKMS